MPNPQTEKLAVVSDPSLVGITGINQTNTQPNMAKLNNKGKENWRFIIDNNLIEALDFYHRMRKRNK